MKKEPGIEMKMDNEKMDLIGSLYNIPERETVARVKRSVFGFDAVITTGDGKSFTGSSFTAARSLECAVKEWREAEDHAAEPKSSTRRRFPVVTMSVGWSRRKITMLRKL